LIIDKHFWNWVFFSAMVELGMVWNAEKAYHQAINARNGRLTALWRSKICAATTMCPICRFSQIYVVYFKVGTRVAPLWSSWVGSMSLYYCSTDDWEQFSLSHT
jgi:hypothetical protein